MRNVSDALHDIRQLVSTLLKRPALRIVKPATFLRWHRQGFRLFWRWKSHPGRPALPKNLRSLIRRMALGQRVVARPVMGGWHHEYGLETRAA